VSKHNFNIPVNRVTKITCSLLVLSGALLILSSTPVSALGLAVSPGKLHMESPQENQTTSSYLTVTNTNSTMTKYRIYVQTSDQRDNFTIEPSEFLLRPGTNEKVEIRFHPDDATQIMEKAYICVVTQPGSGELRIGAGVRVPVSFDGM
jgi:P pilus assembly chaperone PapD